MSLWKGSVRTLRRVSVGVIFSKNFISSGLDIDLSAAMAFVGSFENRLDRIASGLEGSANSRDLNHFSFEALRMVLVVFSPSRRARLRRRVNIGFE